MDSELKAMQDVFKALEPLDIEAQGRVLTWVGSRLDVELEQVQALAGEKINKDWPTHSSATENHDGGDDSFAEMFHIAGPKTNAEKVLVASYWVQLKEGLETFPSNRVNRELQNLGYEVANITDGFTQLMKKRPALAIQVRKSGRSRQARKSYKLTHPGLEHVRNMLRSGEIGWGKGDSDG